MFLKSYGPLLEKARSEIFNSESRDDKKSEVQYLVSDNHPAIITEEIFEAVQKEKANRSNIVVDENGQSVRKSTKYSSKNKN